LNKWYFKLRKGYENILAELIEDENARWIKKNEPNVYTKEFSPIVEFYVFTTPCGHTSSRGISMKDRGCAISKRAEKYDIISTQNHGRCAKYKCKT
jgi:hypothetical protein